MSATSQKTVCRNKPINARHNERPNAHRREPLNTPHGVLPSARYSEPAHTRHCEPKAKQSHPSHSTLRIKKLALTLIYSLVLLCSLVNTVQARLEVCNQTDLVLMVAVGYDTTEGRTASEGWWRVYPGYCEVPVDVAMLKGSYYLHAESNPRSTMPVDAFTWGEEKPLCVKLADFRIPDGNFCEDGHVAVSFNQVDKNWRNYNKIDIYYAKRSYENQFRARVAGIQRMLSMLGYDIGEIDGMPGEKTVDALDEIGVAYQVFGFNFRTLYPLLEKLIAEKQKLDN